MKLKKYTEITETQYNEYITEWEAVDEMTVPFASKRREKKFSELLKIWQSDETDIMYEKGFVPSTLYFFTDENKRIIGAIHLRHELNDSLLQNGGHIGYGIRPSERKKGYATQMLAAFLSKIWGQDYDKVLITCDDDNPASAKTIEKNGGELMDKPVIKGTITRRYWIFNPNK